MEYGKVLANHVSTADENADLDNVYARIEDIVKSHEDALTQEERDVEVNTILSDNRLKEVEKTTMYKWLKFLGFKNKTFEKSFNCDGHEAEDTVEYRIKFILKYIEYERRSFRWVCLKESELKMLMELRKVDSTFDKFGTDVTSLARNSNISDSSHSE